MRPMWSFTIAGDFLPLHKSFHISLDFLIQQNHILFAVKFSLKSNVKLGNNYFKEPQSFVFGRKLNF